MNSLRKEPKRYKKNIQARRTPRAEGAGECGMFRQSWACGVGAAESVRCNWGGK